eukprot:COSAG04_NODE_2830_length_3521_cov_1.507306_4_plen_584_part_01
MELLRTADPAEARRLVAEHGACILAGLRPAGDAAFAASQAIWGNDLRSAPPVAEVSMAVNQPPRQSTGVPMWHPGVSRRPTNATERYDGTPGQVPPRAYDELLEPHSDGYAYGDAYPDKIVLLCAQDCQAGGETFLVDGFGVLDALERGSAQQRWAAEALATRPINQGEAGRRASMSTVVQTAPSGGRMLRCTLWVQRPNDDNSAEEQRKDAEMLAAYHEAVMAAPRAHVKLKPGEALVFDNCAAPKSLRSMTRSARPCFRPVMLAFLPLTVGVLRNRRPLPARPNAVWRGRGVPAALAAVGLDRESLVFGRDMAGARFRMVGGAEWTGLRLFDESIQTCRDLCIGWPFMAMQLADECFCGNTYGSYAQVDDELCGTEGDECGTGNATLCQLTNAVFRIPHMKTCAEVVCAAGTALKEGSDTLSVRGELSAGEQATCCETSCAVWGSGGGTCAAGTRYMTRLADAMPAGSDPQTSCCTAPCVPGTWDNDGRCEPCAAGTISTSTDAAECIDCGPGQYSPKQSTACTSCVAGKYDHDKNASTECVDCDAGTFTAATGAAAICYGVCAAGTYGAAGAQSSNDCIEC